MSAPTRVPRALATRLLAAAQRDGGHGVRGAVLADASGDPANFVGDGEPGGRVWAAFLGGREPATAEILQALKRAPRVLVARLDVKGVLKLELHVADGAGTRREDVGIVGE